MVNQPPKRNGCHWLPHEDGYLCKHYPHIGCRACADWLRRSLRATYERASSLGLRVLHKQTGRPAIWTDRQEQLVRHMVHAIAAETGYSETAVVSRIRRIYRAGGFKHDAESDDRQADSW